MRAWPFGMVLLAGSAAARADGPAVMQQCLSSQDMREIVQTNKVVAPAAALRAAQQAVPRGDVVRANLCRRDQALVYVIVSLRKDGRFAYVTVDAASGKVAEVQ